MLIRVFALLLLLLPQDPAIKALVDKLASDEIAERDAAASELVKLGPATLPQLRTFVATAAGDQKVLLIAVIRQLERLIKKDEIVRGPRITLAGGVRPVAQIFADIARQAGCRIDVEGVPADAKVDASLSQVPLAKAVDQVCKAHGGIMYAYSAQRIIIEPKPYREFPRLFHEGVLFFLDHLLLDRVPSVATPRMLLKPVIAWPPGAGPLAYRLETATLVDDLGTDLLTGNQPPSWIWFRGPVGDTLCSPLYYHSFPGGVPDGATRIASWKGILRLRFPVEMKPAISIEKPFDAPPGGKADGLYQLRLHSAKLVGRDASISVLISTPLKDDPEVDYYNLGLANLLVLRDSKGGMIRGEGQTRAGTGAPHKEEGRATRWLEFSYKVPEGAVVTSLDLMKLDDLEDVEIPFDFKDIKIREAAR